MLYYISNVLLLLFSAFFWRHVTEEVTEMKMEEIDDEIELTEISVKDEEECAVDKIIKIEGEFKNLQES